MTFLAKYIVPSINSTSFNLFDSYLTFLKLGVLVLMVAPLD